MISNKITEKLSKILSKEITQIELSIPSFDSKISSDSDSSMEEKIKLKASHLILPVTVDGLIPIIILFSSFEAMKSEGVKAALLGAKINYEFDIIPAIAANAGEGQILKLSELGQVKQIGFDDYVTATLDTARKWFEVDKSVKTFHLTGHESRSKDFTKKDNVIAILDTGIDINHVDLGSGKVIGWHDEINPSSTTPYDDNGHGTHVASIAAGLGKAIWDYRGVAFGAALVGVKVLDATGHGSYSQIIAGIQWCVNNKNTFGIRVINMSLGGSSDTAVKAAVTVAVNTGIVVVCAAGNDGPSLNTIGSPGDTLSAITVGNMSDVGQGGYFLVPSSSRGPVNISSVKPDICAPGYFITAAKAGTINQYTTMTGTSMASPFVAGVVALMLDANSSLTPSEIKNILIETANTWGNIRPNNDYGYGKLETFDALRRVCKLRGSRCSHPCDPGFMEEKDSCLYAHPAYVTPCKNPLQPEHFSVSGTITDPTSSDWYEVYVTKLGYPLAITLLTTTPNTDVNLYLYDANYSLISSSTFPTRQDTISFIPTAYGKYLIRVYRNTGTTVNYQLDLSVFGKNFRWFETN